MNEKSSVCPSTNPNSELPKLDAEKTSNNKIESIIENSILYSHPELNDAKIAIIDGLTSPSIEPSQLRLAWIEYAKISEQIVESVINNPEAPNAYEKAQIEAIIHKALIFKSAGNILRYLEELDCAEVYAYNINLGFDEISMILCQEISKTVETLDMSPEVLLLKLKDVIEEDNREFLRDLINEGSDLEDIISAAYGMLIDEGKDPDSTLTELGVLDF